MKNQFKGKQYDYRIIIEAISLYYHFGQSYCACAKIMREFSIGMDYTTIYRWDKQYGKGLLPLMRKMKQTESLVSILEN